MDLSKFQKTKGCIHKVKKTFYMTADEENIYNTAKEHGIDSTHYVTQAIKNAIEDIRKALEKIK